jgi:hypothetical protein
MAVRIAVRRGVSKRTISKGCCGKCGSCRPAWVVVRADPCGRYFDVDPCGQCFDVYENLRAIAVHTSTVYLSPGLVSAVQSMRGPYGDNYRCYLSRS